jgi:hypothetical protein
VKQRVSATHEESQEGDMHGALEWFKEEFRKVMGVAAFFAAAFCLIVLANKLMVEGSDIEVVSFATAIFGGLIVAKVLLIADLLPFVDAFRGKPLIYNIVWKSLIYITASLIFHYIEPLVKFLFTGASLAAAHHHAMQAFTHPMFWANEIWVAMLLVLFVTMRELSRALGKDQMRRLFFGGSQASEKEKRHYK